MNKLLIYIVSYQRKSYTIGTIELLQKSMPLNADIVICDNGSTDGTREWLQDNQEKYNLMLLFPDENLRVGGAWTLLTKYFDSTDYDYILLLDNDGWIVPNTDWFSSCMDIFNTDNKIGSLGLQKERRPGYFSMEKTYDINYDHKIKLNSDLYVYDTIYYAAFRLDKFSLWHQTMSNWPHKFIGDKIGSYYNSKGFRTVKVTPGFIVDISEYNFDNKDHELYNIDFYEKERDVVEYKRRITMHSSNNENTKYISDLFGKEFLKYL